MKTLEEATSTLTSSPSDRRRICSDVTLRAVRQWARQRRIGQARLTHAHEAAFLVGIEERSAVLERAELHLVEYGSDVGRRHHLVQLRDAEVGDADGARRAELVRPLHARPCPRRAAAWPVDDVKVEVVDAEPLEAPFRLSGGVLAAWIEPVSYTHLTLPTICSV